MKTITRFRWLLVGILLLILYLFDRKSSPWSEETFWFFMALFVVASLRRQLERIEYKLDAISKRGQS